VAAAVVLWHPWTRRGEATGPAPVTSAPQVPETSLVQTSPPGPALTDSAAPPPPATGDVRPPASGPVRPAPPAPSDRPSASGDREVFRFTDEQGVVNWTDRWDSIPEQYRSQAKRLPL